MAEAHVKGCYIETEALPNCAMLNSRNQRVSPLLRTPAKVS